MKTFDFLRIQNDSQVIHTLKDFYDENGFVIIERVFENDDIEDIQLILNEIADRRKKQGYNPYSNYLAPHLDLPAVVDTARNDRLVQCVNYLLKGQPDLLNTQILFNPPGTIGYTTHQDNWYNRTKPADGMITCWIPLEKCDPLNGTIYVFPGSHREDLLPTKKDWVFLAATTSEFIKAKLRSFFTKSRVENKRVLSRFLHTAVPEKYEKVAVEIEPGSVCLFHGNLVHGSWDNSSNRYRKVLVVCYIREDASFRKGLFANRRRITLGYSSPPHSERNTLILKSEWVLSF